MAGFDKARPIWIDGREHELNCRVQFKAFCPAAEGAMAKIATSGIYQLWVNGEFVAYGPARAGKGVFRMDEIALGGRLTKPENAVVLEVCGYNSNSFYIQEQPSFLQAEIVAGDTVCAATGEDFTARLNPYAVQKTQRYSFQRPTVEAYRYAAPADGFLRDGAVGIAALAVTEEKPIIARRSPYPAYERLTGAFLTAGSVSRHPLETYYRDRSVLKAGDLLAGFPAEQVETLVTDLFQELTFTPAAGDGRTLPENGYGIWKLPHNATGMITLRVRCDAPMTLLTTFDELLTDGHVNGIRGNVTNVLRCELGAGEYDLHFFEVYTMQYIQLIALDGACEVIAVGLTEYKHPPVRRVRFADPELQEIADAATETFRQNSVDVLTDCPSRERAGWLCDSFFTGRTEHHLTGENPVEKSFLENFLHEEAYAYLPQGMVPMCYPADHKDGCFLPNWSFWLVLELKDYLERTGDRALVDAFADKVRALFAYFAPFENEVGLLEGLQGWLFLEWSPANDFMEDVNYPTNMLYAKALDTAAFLYGEPAYAEKASAIRETVRRLSFDGTFFTDNAVRRDGVLCNTGNTSETCQYYAFFCDVATPERDAALYRRMVTEFGPFRAADAWPQIPASAAFIGDFLRLWMLMRTGEYERALSDIKGYFLTMARTTGTLWEHAVNPDSCCHGFASHVLCWLEQIELKGVNSRE